MQQTTAEKIIPQFTVMERAVIYARVSTDEQADNTSLDNQVQKSLVYAESNGLQVAPEMIFREDFTGTVLDRPELTKIRQLFRSGQADSLIVYKPNRLDRSEWGVNLLILLQELKALGIELHYSRDGRQVDLNNPVEALMQSIEGWQAGEDKKESVARMTEGVKSRVESGYVVSARAPYGYKRIETKGGWQFEIIESQAQIVRMIFGWYTAGTETGQPLSIREIARKLRAGQIPTKTDLSSQRSKKQRGYAEWSPATVRSMLGNETYIGTWHHGKYGRKNGKRFKHPKSEWTPVPVPAIIDSEIFEAARKRCESNKRQANNLTNEYLLSGHVTCGHCGYRLRAVTSSSRRYSYSYYRCPSDDPQIGLRDCDLPGFRVDWTDGHTWQWIEDICTDENKLAECIDDYRAGRNQAAQPIKDRLAIVDDLIDQQNRDLSGSITSLKALEDVRAERAIASLKADITRIEATLDGLEAERATLLKKLEQVTMTDEQAFGLKQMCAEIGRDIETFRNDFESKQMLVDRLRIEVVLSVDEDGRKWADIEAVIGPKRLLVEGETIAGYNLNSQPIGQPLRISTRLEIIPLE